METIGFIGGGAMAEAIIKGMIGAGRPAETIMVSDPATSRLDYLKNTYGVIPISSNGETAVKSDCVILAVKPQNMMEAIAAFANTIRGEKLLVSILAGVNIARLETLLPRNTKVVRVVPNTPALIGMGTTVLAGSLSVEDEDMALVQEIFKSVGDVIVLPEPLLNAVTGLSGSGPAFVYLMIEALADGGVMAGLPRDVAYKLAADTVKGAASMVTQTGMHPGELKDKVTSPGGTTIYGLLEMEKAGVRGTLMETVLAAARRAEKL